MSYLFTTPQERVLALQSKHKVLAERINEAQKHPSTADFYIRQLKKQKLMIKEELEGIRRKTASA